MIPTRNKGTTNLHTARHTSIFKPTHSWVSQIDKEKIQPHRGYLDLLIQATSTSKHSQPSNIWVPWTYSAKPTPGCTQQQDAHDGYEGKRFATKNDWVKGKTTLL